MKRLSLRLCALLTGVVSLSACLNDGDDEKTGTYSDVAITQFSLGTLNRYTQTTSTSTGNDTIVKTTVTGSLYKMTIDHMQRRIYNVTELPVGTDVAHVLCTVTAKNSSMIALKSATSDTLSWYSSTDSIDFSTPRTFRVFATDGSAYRDYSVELNVSSTTGVSFEWQLSGTSDEWAAMASGGMLKSAGDSIEAVRRDSIVGTSTAALYMLAADGTLQSSTDAGTTWQQEPLDDSAALLPQQEGAACICWSYAPADNTDYVLLVGQPRQADATTMRVWRKIAPWGGGGQWVYMPFDETNRYPLQRMKDISMAYYNGTVLIVGDDLTMRESRDQGITWRKSTTYALPAGISGTKAIIGTDTQGRLWLLTDSGQLWKGDNSASLNDK